VRRLGKALRTSLDAGHRGNSPLRVSVRGREWARIAAVSLVSRLSLANGVVSVGQSPTEYQVKAACLFNFLRFVEWPEDTLTDAHANWAIGFVGKTQRSANN